MTDIRAIALERLGRGDQLRMQFTQAGRTWWFEAPRLQVPDAIAMAIVTATGAPIGEAGDSLFGLPFNSQTWISTTDQATPIADPGESFRNGVAESAQAMAT